MGLSDEDLQLLKRLKAERAAGDEPEDKINGKRRASEDDVQDEPPTKPKRRKRAVEVEPEDLESIVVETLAESKPAAAAYALRDMLACGALVVAMEFVDKDGELKDVAEIAYELADAMIAVRGK